ncbi:hypothetical protein WBP07_22345 (plasmid) [Novosphingobium sp. BL-8A]|uniref:beta strand repeat-containing protein n=1 Tax=Novosphingobium sp. BL-8A TaxID=3127639 RepID=UPI003757418B
MCTDAFAQQVIANGTVVTAGPSTTTAANGSSGIGLWALNNGEITSSAPITVTTSGSGGAHAAVAESDGSIDVFAGSTLTTTGASAFGAFASGGGTITLEDGTRIIARASALRSALGGTINATNVVASTTGSNTIGANADRGTIILQGGSITTSSGTLNHGLGVTTSGSIEATGVTVSASGEGISATSGGQATFTGGTITSAMTGANASLGSVIAISNASITATGANIAGVRSGNSTVTLSNSSVSTTSTATTGANAIGLLAENNGTLSATGSNVTTSGALSTGAQANTGGTVNLAGSAAARTRIMTQNVNTRGVVTTGGTINVSFTDVFTGSHAIVAENTGQIHFRDGTPTVNATGTNLVGLAVNQGGRIDSTGPLTVNMLAPASGGSAGRTAAYVHDGGQLALAPGAVFNITGGVGGAGITIDNSILEAPVDQLTINLNSSATTGSTGVISINAGQANISNLTVGGLSAGSGVYARGAGSQAVITGTSRFDISASSPNFYELTSTSFLPVGGIIATGFSTTGVTPSTAFHASDGATILALDR